MMRLLRMLFRSSAISTGQTAALTTMEWCTYHSLMSSS